MGNNRTDTTHNHAGKRFAGAVVLYLAGIMAFSGWSYYEHREILDQNTGMEEAMRREQINRTALVEGAEVLFLIAMLFPIIALYHQARARSLHQVEALNTKLKHDNDQLKAHDTELEAAIQDLERFNALANGRELRIIELKSEVNTLLEKLNQPKRYTTAATSGGSTENQDG